MKYITLLAAIGAIGLFASFAPAHAADAKAPAAAPKAAATGQKWTEDDVKKLCAGRWKTDQKRIDACIARHKVVLGKPMNAAAVQELKTGVWVKPPAKKAGK